MGRTENIIKAVHVIWKGSHMNTLRKYIYNETKKDNQYWFQTFTVLWILYSVFWVISRRLNFMFRRFGTHCLFHLNFMCRRFETLFHLILCADVSKHTVPSEFYAPTFRNNVFHLNFMCRRFGTQCSILILCSDVSKQTPIQILYADVSG
jgi:hypothetical protein